MSRLGPNFLPATSGAGRRPGTRRLAQAALAPSSSSSSSPPPPPPPSAGERTASTSKERGSKASGRKGPGGGSTSPAAPVASDTTATPPRRRKDVSPSPKMERKTLSLSSSARPAVESFKTSDRPKGSKSPPPPPLAPPVATESRKANPDRVAQVEYVRSQLEGYIAEAQRDVKTCEEKIQEHQRLGLPPGPTNSAAADASRVGKPARKNDSHGRTHAAQEDRTELHYLGWWLAAAVERCRGLEQARDDMLLEQRRGSTKTPTIADALRAARQRSMNRPPPQWSSSSKTLAGEARPPGLLLASSQQAVLTPGDGPSAADAAPTLVVLDRTFIDPARLPSLYNMRLNNSQRPAEIYLPIEIVHQLRDVLEYESRQAGVVDRLHRFVVDLPDAPLELQTAMRTFVKAVTAAAPADTPLAELSDVFKEVPPQTFEDDISKDLNLLVAQLLSPALNKPELLGPLSDLLWTLRPLKEPAYRLRLANLLRPRLIATLLATTQAPELAEEWLLSPSDKLVQPPIFEYNGAYTSLASAVSLDYPSFKRITTQLLSIGALESTAYIVFLQGLMLRHDSISQLLAEFDRVRRPFVAAGLATADVIPSLRLLDTYADKLGARELRLLVQTRLEAETKTVRDRVRAEEQARREDNIVNSTKLAALADGLGSTKRSRKQAAKLLSRSSVVEKFQVTLDARDEDADRERRQPKADGQDVWTSIARSELVVDFVGYISSVFGRSGPGRFRLPPPGPRSSSAVPPTSTSRTTLNSIWHGRGDSAAQLDRLTKASPASPLTPLVSPFRAADERGFAASSPIAPGRILQQAPSKPQLNAVRSLKRRPAGRKQEAPTRLRQDAKGNTSGKLEATPEVERKDE